MLSDQLGARLVLEKFEENPFLPNFYKDPEHYAFQTQIFFLLSRYRQQQELYQADLFHSHIVSDYIFEKDKIFAYLTLRDDEFEALHHGETEPTGNRCVIAAGTGLGESILFWEGKKFLPAATEGGHCDFAPRNQTEFELLNYLLEKYSRVSYERILSGPGILNLYHFFKRKGEEEPSWLKDSIEKDDPASVISREGLARRSQLCVKTLELFASIYGAEAGNFALKTKATGGVYIGGGIGIKLLKLLKEGTFLRSFLDKGRMEPLMRKMPVMVIKNERTALIGAARYAADFDFSRATR
jgi:glucokinase